MKKRLKILCVALAAALAVRLVLMATMPVFEPSEARYAAISANMARTGDFVSPMFTYRGVYQPFKGKPPLVFQSGGAFCKLLGVCEFAVRLTPFLSFLVLLALLFHAVKTLHGPASACLAVGICSTSAALYATAGVCMTDVPLTCCASGALLLYACFRERPLRRYALGVGVLLGCGMLVKGPVALVLFCLPVVADAALNRRWRTVFDVRWLWAVPVFLLVATPWFVVMQSRYPDFLRYFFLNENLLRFLVREYGDRYGAGRETFRGMALVWTLVVAMPWTLFLARDALKRRWEAFSRRSFFLVSAVCVAAFWCLTSRVPMAYLLPTVPLLAAHLASARRMRLRLWRALPFAASLVTVLTAGTLIAGSLFSDKMLGKSSPKRVSRRCYAYEFYHGPWGEGAPR